jgi:hypothetical protein
MRLDITGSGISAQPINGSGCEMRLKPMIATDAQTRSKRSQAWERRALQPVRYCTIFYIAGEEKK